MDFRKEFFKEIELGQKDPDPMRASLELSIRISKLINSEYAHIKNDCECLIESETIKMINEREQKRKEAIGELVDGFLSSRLCVPCDNPNCESCVAEKAKREEEQQGKNGFTKTPTHPGNGSIN